MNSQQDNFKVSVILVLSIYFLIGNFFLSSGSGWIPNFNLASFGKQPAEVSRYELKFSQIDGQQLAEPIYFSEMNGMLGSEDIYEGKRLVNRLGHALFIEDYPTAISLSKQLEREFLSTLGEAEFEVVFIDTDPVEKYSLDSFVSERVLSSFQLPLGESIAASE